MSDEPTGSDGTADSGGAGPRWPVIAGVVAVVALITLGIVAVVVSNDDGDSATTTVLDTTAPPETDPPPTTATTDAPETTAAPETTEAPETTAATETTAAPETTGAPETTEAPAALAFSIEDIEDGEAIPVEFGAGGVVDQCDGDNRVPVVSIDGAPDGAVQLALVVDDPDAPTEDPFVHWVVYGVPGTATAITDGVASSTYGTNDAGTLEWFGPCPPVGDGPHRYVFTLYVLDQELSLEPGLDGRQLATAIAGSVVTQSTIIATYERTAG